MLGMCDEVREGQLPLCRWHIVIPFDGNALGWHGNN
jgi:hypothetical protein